MIVVGGLGSLEGAVLGAFLLTFAPEYMRVFKDYRLVLYGLLIVVMMIGMPRGLAGLSGQVAGMVRRRRGRRQPGTVSEAPREAEPELGRDIAVL
jgi:branched-chain amino acid transport system permease protein